MDWSDLRGWLDRADALGQVVRLEGLDCNLEVGALAELAFQENDAHPAVLLDRLIGYEPGYRLLLNPVGSRDRLALTLGLPLGLSDLELVDHWRRALGSIQPVPAQHVPHGPVLENIQQADDVDVCKFPAPFWHTDDGGKYLGTGDLVITRDPEEGWVNAGTYRAMVHDKNRLGMYINPNGHGSIHMRKYFAQGEPCPVVICLGSDPLLFVAACSRLPAGLSELDYVGGARGKAVNVIEGPLTGLPIPASAEVALEGEILAETLPEGPFGEFHGYYATGQSLAPVIRVKAVYHRDDPILLGVPPLVPPSDNTFIHLYSRPAIIWNELEAAGVPDVKGVWGLGGLSVFFLVVAIRQRYAGHAKQAGILTSQFHGGGHMLRYVVVVDDDIDITNVDQVLWAMTTRCDPETQIDLVRRCVSAPIDPLVAIRPGGDSYTSRLIIDACRPFERRADFPPVIATSPQLKADLQRRFGKALGLKTRG